MKIALRSMGTSTFFKIKNVNTNLKNIKNALVERCILIIRNTKTIKNEFCTV